MVIFSILLRYFSIIQNIYVLVSDIIPWEGILIFFTFYLKILSVLFSKKWKTFPIGSESNPCENGVWVALWGAHHMHSSGVMQLDAVIAEIFRCLIHGSDLWCHPNKLRVVGPFEVMKQHTGFGSGFGWGQTFACREEGGSWTRALHSSVEQEGRLGNHTRGSPLSLDTQVPLEISRVLGRPSQAGVISARE